jgi:hypothetical protein
MMARLSLKTVLSAFAPVTIVLTGMLYIAGWAHQRTLLRHFGLNAGMFDSSVQDTFAQGYGPVLFGTVITGAIIIVFALLYRFAVTRTIPSGGWPGKMGRVIDRLHQLIVVAVCAFLILSYAAIAGGIFGASTAVDIAKTVNSGCRECFIYVVAPKPIRGVIIAQDKDRLAIYSTEGVRIRKNDDVLMIVPSRPLTTDPILDGLPFH